MTQLVIKRQVRRGRIFDTTPLTPEEINNWRQEGEELHQSCYPVFEKLRSRLISTHYNWFIAIASEGGYYLLDPNFQNLMHRIKIYCPQGKLMTFRINETGICGQI